MPSSNPEEKRTVVRGLGEVAFRVNNLDAMQKFYEEVLGLPWLPAAKAALAITILLALTLISTRSAQAQTYTVIHNFTGGGDGRP